MEKTLRELRDEAIVRHCIWSVHDGQIELVPMPDEELPYNRDTEMKLQRLGIEWRFT